MLAVLDSGGVATFMWVWLLDGGIDCHLEELQKEIQIPINNV